MQISQMFKRKPCVFSIECFPPKQTANFGKMKDTLRTMRTLNPDFISVTYGAGGSTGGVSTVEVAEFLKNDLNVEPLAHMICMGSDKAKAAQLLDQLNAAGVRNVLTLLNWHEVSDREVSLLGNVSLSLFLAMALMSLRLWDLANLALPIFVLLAAQTVAMALYAIFVTFRVMGSNYDAAVLAAGHCGFGLGATPTAIANMQAITQRFGPSHLAFLVVPMVGAFFIDIINAMVIKLFLALPFL